MTDLSTVFWLSAIATLIVSAIAVGFFIGFLLFATHALG